MQKKQISGGESIGVSRAGVVKPTGKVSANNVSEVLETALKSHNLNVSDIEMAVNPNIFHEKIKEIERKQLLNKLWDIGSAVLVSTGASIGILSNLVAFPRAVSLTSLAVILLGSIKPWKMLGGYLRGVEPENYEKLRERIEYRYYLDNRIEYAVFIKQVKADINDYYSQNEVDKETKRQEVWNVLQECFPGLCREAKMLMLFEILGNPVDVG
jgi:hypothetical protein